MSQPCTDVLRLRDVRRRFGASDSGVQALRGVHLACSAGSWTAIMGPSGSGKTTLLTCAAGLDRPTSGSVQLAGREVTELSDDQLTRMRRTSVGFIFQGFNLVQALTAEQNVTLPLRLAGRRPDARLVRSTLAQLGLGERMRHHPRELSGGQQQRVAIARALITRPAVLFADEPTGALDTTAASTVLELMRRLVQEQRQTILMVTHDPGAAARADRVVFMRDGRIVAQQPGGDAATLAARLALLEQEA